MACISRDDDVTAILSWNDRKTFEMRIVQIRAEVREEEDKKGKERGMIYLLTGAVQP